MRKVNTIRSAISVSFLSLSLLLSSLFSFNVLAQTETTGFSDVDESYIYYDAILYVQAADIVKGYPNGTYKPENPINRAEFTKVVINSQYTDEEIRSCTQGGFKDIPVLEWFAGYVCLAKQEGIISGYSDGDFKPGRYTNFTEASKVIVSAYDFAVDANSGSVWYEPYVKVLDDRNAIPTTIESLSAKLTRGEMAEIIYRLDNNITDKPSLTYDELVTADNSQNEDDEDEQEVEEYEVYMQNSAFVPSTLTIKIGDTVVWENGDAYAHTVTSGTPESPSNLFDSNNLDEGETFSYKFEVAGTFPYFCKLHTNMKGTVVVEPVDENEDEEENEEGDDVSEFDLILVDTDNITTEVNIEGQIYLYQENNLDYQIKIDGLTDKITSAYFYLVSAVNSPLQTVNFVGWEAAGKWRVKSTWSDLSTEEITALMNDQLYLKIKTEEQGDIEVQVK
ncbi:hypothetical protein A2335_01890 [Candidatus Peregrinibacteria bacterium RIFOXYB2_FULL_32_7]|nr:MAG: hypothetical protein A2335_01890 [Candidatus Peregrinibacteria bacterium RIFOXYB2_FULL_32_7]